MRYLKLLGIFLKSSLLMELEYRANFVTQCLLGVFWACITLVSVSVFFLHTDELGGWSYDQALVIVALFTLIDGIIRFAMQPNIEKVIQMVREGTMDFVLTKPVNSQFIATLRYVRYAGVADMASALLILALAFARLNYLPDAMALAQFALMFAAALVIVYSIWLVMAALSFWFVRIDNLTVLFHTLYDTARFPVSTFSGVLRLALTIVLPVAFMTTFPAQAILGQLDWRALVGASAMAALLFASGAWFWRKAVMSYSSASS